MNARDLPAEFRLLECITSKRPLRRYVAHFTPYAGTRG